MNTFSIKESIKYGWEVFKNNKGLWVATLAIFVLMVLSGPQQEVRHFNGVAINYPSFGLIGFIACIALIVAKIGYTKLILKILDGEKFEWPQALEVTFNTHKVFWKYIGSSILSGLVTVLSFILLFIPGLFVLPMYIFATFIAIDTGARPMASLRESAAITKGSRLKIWGLLIVSILVNILGAIALGVGLFISIPVTTIAFVHVYRKLLAAKASPAVI